MTTIPALNRGASKVSYCPENIFGSASDSLWSWLDFFSLLRGRRGFGVFFQDPNKSKRFRCLRLRYWNNRIRKEPSSIRRQQLIRECPILSNTPDEGLINAYILSKPVKFQDIVLFLLLCKEYPQQVGKG